MAAGGAGTADDWWETEAEDDGVDAGVDGEAFTVAPGDGSGDGLLLLTPPAGAGSGVAAPAPIAAEGTTKAASTDATMLT